MGNLAGNSGSYFNDLTSALRGSVSKGDLAFEECESMLVAIVLLVVRIAYRYSYCDWKRATSEVT